MKAGLSKNAQELYNCWGYARKVCGNGILRENVPCDPNWATFDGFLKDNWFRYYRAKIKWKNYKRVATTDKYSGPLKNKILVFKRYKKELGFTKENTFFSNPSDVSKYRSTTHKYMFEGRMLGTRDIHRILKKRGINIGMPTIVNRLKNGQPLFDKAERAQIKWKGKNRSFVEIAEMEKTALNRVKKNYYRTGSITKSVDKSKSYKEKTHLFEGDYLYLFQIAKILSVRYNVSDIAMRGRLKKNIKDNGTFVMTDSIKAGMYEKPLLSVSVNATKDGKTITFKSIAAAAKELGLKSANVSLAASGKQSHCGGYKFTYNK